MNKNIILAIVFVVVVSVLLGGGVYFYKARQCQTLNVPDQGALIGGQEDEHDCLVPAGYSWCEAKQKCLRIFEEFCPDAVAGLVSAIEANSGVQLENMGESTFNWIVNFEGGKTADYEVAGVLYEAEGVNFDDYMKIENYLGGIAEADTYNLADGVVGGLKGYYYQYMVCDLNFRYQEMGESEEELPEPVGDKVDVKLECGYFNQNQIPDIALQEVVRELLMKKYSLAPDAMKISIEQKIEDHMRGSVAFLDDQGVPASGGYFFAAKTDSIWELVLDGNGQISCSLLSEHNFPQEMMSDCVEE